MTISGAVIWMKTKRRFRLPPSKDSVFPRRITANHRHNSSVLNRCNPFSGFTLNPNAVMAAPIVARESSVPHILMTSATPKIHKPIVRAVTVDVIDVVRIGAGGNFPCDAVSKEAIVQNRSMEIAIRRPRGESRLPRILAIPNVGRCVRSSRRFFKQGRMALFPDHYPSFRVIVDQGDKNLFRWRWFWLHGGLVAWYS